jgi:steroid delta-isomerase-like uncharacterized protein
VFFAAVLGFGLKRLLDTDAQIANKPVEIFTYKWLPYKWLFFLVAAFIFLRLLTASANHVWLEYQKYERPYRRRDDLLITVGLSWLTIFGCFGAYLCYAGNPSQFFWRASYLLVACCAASVLQVLWSPLRQVLWSPLRWTTPIGDWAWGWLWVNFSQFAAVVVLMNMNRTWGVRLVWLAIVSAAILFVDFYWQLAEIKKKLPLSAVARWEMEEIFYHRGNLDAAEEIYAPDFVGHKPTSGNIQGVAGAKQFAATYRQAFPDLQPTIEDQVAEGDKVVTRFSVRGTHQGETDEFGHPTGKRMEITGITIERFSKGKIVEAWTHFDVLGMKRQLGLIPEAAGLRS